MSDYYIEYLSYYIMDKIVIDYSYLPMIDACRSMKDLARFIVEAGENKFRYERGKLFLRDENDNWYHDEYHGETVFFL